MGGAVTARLLGTMLLACAGAGLGACGAVRRPGGGKAHLPAVPPVDLLRRIADLPCPDRPHAAACRCRKPRLLRRWPSRRIAIVRCRPYPCQTCPKRWQGSCTPAWPPWGTATRAAACAELRRMADLCRREADRQADRAARAMALWPRLGGWCGAACWPILLW